MFDFLDLILLRRGIPSDDRTLTFRRIDGDPHSKVVYFLPWHTSYGFARRAGLVPLDFLACYEMPPAIVSSEPELTRMAMLGLVADAESLLAYHAVRPEELLVVGLSVGNYVATYLANRMGARLCSVAPADRVDLMIWQSPAARMVKRRAVQKGFGLSDYASATEGCHPAGNLSGIRPESLFVVGRRDPFVPPSRSAGLRAAIAAHVPSARVIELDAGHLKTLVASGRHQRSIFGQPGVRSDRREDAGGATAHASLAAHGPSPL